MANKFGIACKTRPRSMHWFAYASEQFFQNLWTFQNEFRMNLVRYSLNNNTIQIHLLIGNGRCQGNLLLSQAFLFDALNDMRFQLEIDLRNEQIANRFGFRRFVIVHCKRN